MGDRTREGDREREVRGDTRGRKIELVDSVDCLVTLSLSPRIDSDEDGGRTDGRGRTDAKDSRCAESRQAIDSSESNKHQTLLFRKDTLTSTFWNSNSVG